MEQFLEIFLKPDNIPISAMVPIIIFTIWLSLKQAFANDRLIKAGKKDQIYNDMMK